MPRLLQPRSRVSDQELARAVAAATPVAQALRYLGLCASGANYRFMHHAVARLSLDTSRWRLKPEWPSDEQIAAAVAQSSSAAQVLHRFGLSCSGRTYSFVRQAIERLRLDTDHWLGQAHLRGKSHNWAEGIPLSKLLVENSTYGCTSRLKQRLIQDGLLQPRCSECEVSHWRGHKLALVLDHINGVYDDNRLENLRLLCPNCHSQTPTFAGRNKGRRARLDKLQHSG